MTQQEIHQNLLRLREVIREEREHAKQLDMRSMAADIQKKESLIQALGQVERLHPDDHALAREIQEENRRNAYLYRTTLNWIRKSMEFFGHRTAPSTYGYSGNTVNSNVNGRLLSGRI